MPIKEVIEWPWRLWKLDLSRMLVWVSYAWNFLFKVSNLSNSTPPPFLDISTFLFLFFFKVFALTKNMWLIYHMDFPRFPSVKKKLSEWQGSTHSKTNNFKSWLVMLEWDCHFSAARYMHLQIMLYQVHQTLTSSFISWFLLFPVAIHFINLMERTTLLPMVQPEYWIAWGHCWLGQWIFWCGCTQ